MKYTPVGVDMAKHVIQIHFINEHMSAPVIFKVAHIRTRETYRTRRLQT
ncbi:IS110 family transposase, partial [Shigella flexneri]